MTERIIYDFNNMENLEDEILIYAGCIGSVWMLNNKFKYSFSYFLNIYNFLLFFEFIVRFG